MTREQIHDQYVAMAKKDAQQAITSLCGFIPYDEALAFVKGVFDSFEDFDMPSTAV